MALISLQDVKKFYGKQDVLRDAGLYINAGERVGLVGRNGAGKSTIIRLILGEETPDEGFVHKPKSLRLGYLPQDLMHFTGRTLLDLVMDTAEEVRAIESELSDIAIEIEEFSTKSDKEDKLIELTDRQGRLLELFDSLGGYTLEAEARKILHGLGFTENDMDRLIDEFSGGWIMRAVLARLLLSKPDILLLDEPTNHLDIDSLLWLENYLQTCPSALLLVSHDRIFLNNVVKRIIEIERGQAASYNGSYDAFLIEKERRIQTQAAAYASQQDKIKQIEKFIEKNKVRASTARRAQSRMKMLDKMEKLDAPLENGPQSFKLTLPPAPRGPDYPIELSGVSKSYGDLSIYRNMNLTVRRGDRIAFIGANGKGKSTLLKILAGATDFQEGDRRVGPGVVISYFAQFQLEELDPNRTILEELDSVAGDLTPGRLRSILGGFLFKGDDVFKKVAVLSGGEKSRLILAKIMTVGPNLLLLDEPTNHLDIPGREMLEQALKQYDGTICLISHDRHLINSIANKVLVIENGGVEVFPGDFTDYREIWENKLKADEQTGKGSPPPADVKPVEIREGSRSAREARKKAEAEARQKLYRQKAPLTRKVEKLESRLDDLGRRLDELSEALAQPETYADLELSKSLNLEYAEVKSEMDTVTAEWESAALELEELENQAE